VRHHYDVWAKPDENGESLLDRILRKLVEAEQGFNARNPETTMLITVLFFAVTRFGNAELS
jgi:hypothetical protein